MLRSISQWLFTGKRPTIRQAAKAFSPAFEQLDDRIVPANAVTTSFSGGTLTILAQDDGAVIANNHNDITLTGNGNGNFAIAGNGTTINGSTNFANVQNIVIKMGLGNDKVRFNTAQLTGNLNINGGEGTNTVIIGDTVGNCSFGSVKITNGDGFDRLTIQKGFNVIVGALTVNNGQGSSSFDFNTQAADQCLIGSMNITNGNGDDDYIVGGTDFTVQGATTIKNGLGDSKGFLFATNHLSFGGALSVTNGEGFDLWGFGVGTTQVDLHNVTFVNGNGDSFLILDGPKTTIDGNVSITCGTGADFFGSQGTMPEILIAGNVTLKYGSGASTTELETSSKLTIGGAFSATSTTGDDVYQFGAGGTVELHNVTLNNGDGASYVKFHSNNATNTITGNLKITNADGADKLDVVGQQFHVTGNVTLANGNGSSETQFVSMVSTSIQGALKITNGDGLDKFSLSSIFNALGNVTIVNGNGGSETVFGSGFGTIVNGNLSVTCGEGKDTFDVGGLSWEVTGNVTLATGNGDSDIDLDAGAGPGIGNKIGGKLTITGGTGGDLVTLQKVQVAKATNIILGDGGFFDFLNVDNSIFDAAFTVKAGGGTDFLNIEMALNDGVGTTFKGPVLIDAGTGDDFLSLGFNGMDATDFVTFEQAPTFKGGVGLDTLKGVGGFNKFLGGLPLLSGWEAVS